MGKIFAHDTSNKEGLYSKLIKNFYNYTKKAKHPFKKWAELNRYFSTEVIWIANRHMKKFSHHFSFWM